ncbi:dipeptidase PepV [Nicoliella spurrieriana]|uniref:Dipeptidase PepV n=1 Tax=Nicoliella spurrieriana TaxID=2925830 RepID=A0A976RS16_9LACO|nr:dipeptidase PepV [Nicoliella spurrieriana]UQS86753.1 dipeptidase PepV [Nicoliella spurrieriana]
MTVDWKQRAKAYQDDYLNDLKELVSIDSERDDAHASDEFPLGPGPAAALAKYLEIGKRDGFKTKNYDNLAGYIEYGDGDKTLGIIVHADVMPAGEGWNTDPFELTIKDNVAYGRGTSDDKGPGLAAYYGLRMLKDAGIQPKFRIRFLIGTDEESNWTGIKHYLKTEPAPDLGFSPDAEFPVINGEKGNTTFVTTFSGHNAGEEDTEFTLRTFKAGLRDNMVPRDAFAVVESDDNERVSDDFTKFLDHYPVSGDSELTDGGLQLHVIGKSAHGMEPDDGVNAGTYLATFLNQYPFSGDAKHFVSFIANKLHDDSRGHQLGINLTDDVMGDLTMNVGIMRYDIKDGGMVNTNFRYPKGMGPADIQRGLTNGATAGNVTQEDDMGPHFVSADDPFVKTLISVYKELTGETDAKPHVVGGGSFARLMERGVAFGALFPWTKNTMHQANEFQPIDDLMLAMAIYGKVLATLNE